MPCWCSSTCYMQAHCCWGNSHHQMERGRSVVYTLVYINKITFTSFLTLCSIFNNGHESQPMKEMANIFLLVLQGEKNYNIYFQGCFTSKGRVQTPYKVFIILNSASEGPQSMQRILAMVCLPWMMIPDPKS